MSTSTNLILATAVVGIGAVTVGGIYMIDQGLDNSDRRYEIKKQAPTYPVVDQCKRTEAYQSCLKNLPKGPERLTASGNDWKEVVEQCDENARVQSIRQRQYVQPECLGD